MCRRLPGSIRQVTTHSVIKNIYWNQTVAVKVNYFVTGRIPIKDYKYLRTYITSHINTEMNTRNYNNFQEITKQTS